MNARVEEHGAEKETLVRIVLVGFMGAGKTTVGSLLAEHLGWRFLDVDAVIEQRTGSTVDSLFTKCGEAFFRAQERTVIRELAGGAELVLALGGGALEDRSTLNLLLALTHTCIVYLEAPLPVLLARCRAGGAARPLLGNAAELEQRHARRLGDYAAAHLTLSTSDMAPGAVAHQALARIAKRWSIAGNSGGGQA